jgi:thiol-disulfide isomerase/thioredoxin
MKRQQKLPVLFLLFLTALLSAWKTSQTNMTVFQTAPTPVEVHNDQLTEKPFTVRIKFTGYAQAVDSFQYGKFIYQELYHQKPMNIVAGIDSANILTGSCTLMRSQEVMFQFNNESCWFYAIPGDTLDIELNLPAYKIWRKQPYNRRIATAKPMRFSGDGAEINEAFTAFLPISDAILTEDNQKNADSLGAMDYKKFRTSLRDRLLDTLKTFNVVHNTTPVFRELMINRIIYRTATDLIWRRLREKTAKITAPISLDNQYFDFLADAPVNNLPAINTIEYNNFLTAYSNLFLHGMLMQFSKADTLRFVHILRGQGIKIPAAEEALIIAYQKSHNPAKKPAVDAFFKRYKKENIEYCISYIMFYNMVDTICRRLLPGTGRDILMTRLLIDPMEMKGLSLPLAEMEKRVTYIADHQLKKTAYRFNDAVKAAAAAVKLKFNGGMPAGYTMLTPLQASQDKFFSTLMKPYKGKVVYIDFWAPWCGPCIGEMPNSKTLKKEMTGKDVVFLFIGVNCDREWWRKTIMEREIQGEHYHTSADEYNLLSGKFGISGIPHYVLVDKEGNVAMNNAPRPGNPATIKKLMELLKR